MENRYLKHFTFLLLLVFTNFFINAQNFINYGPSDGLIEGGIYSIIEDHNNVFWFGSWTNPEGTGGLGSFDGTTFNQYSTNDGLVGNNVTVVFEDSAYNLWIGTTTGVSKFDGSVITNYTIDNGLVFNHVWDILEDTNGNIWFSTHQGVSMFDGNTWTNYTIEDYPALVYVNDMMMDANGDIWFGSAGGGGVSKFDGAIWTNYTTENSGLVANDVFVVYQDIDNNYWFGTYFGGGVSKFDGTTWTAYTTADGLSNNKVRVITQDSFGDLWFGTNTGLSRYNGSSWQTYTTADGLIPGGVRAITQDSNDDLWIGTWSSGLSKLEISKVNIPDANFEQSLLDLGIDSDRVLNGQILRADAIPETDLNLTNPLFQSDGFENLEITTVTGKIADLSGIEAFVNLTSLQLGNASLRSVDISNNTKLDNLFFNDNLLMSIDVSKNTLLTRFGVMRNPDIAGLDVSNNLLLEELFVDGTAMTSIDVSSNINLWKFYGRWGNLTGIDLSNNINLRDIRLRGSGNLTYLNIRNGNNINVTAFDVRDMANLSCITTDDAQSQLMIDFSNGKTFSPDCGTVYIPDQNFEQALIDLGIDATGTLDGIILRSEAETVTELWLLPVGHPGRDPRLTFTGQIVDLSGIESFTSLIQLHCVQQNINTIDFSSNTNLRVISLPENGLTSINVENNLLLDHLFLFNNNLTTIDVSNNLLLRELVLQSNLITELDISGNTNIKTLFATDNNLTNLNIANGNNANFQIPYGAVSFGAAANPDLACIQVDPDMIGNIGAQPWEYDTGVLFSADCDTKPEYVAIPDTNFEQALIDLGIDGNIGDPINGFILKSDAEAVVELNVNNRGINDLTGIEAFTSLSVLYCQYNQLQELNVTNNAALTILECEGNELTELNVTQNPLLRVLGFGPNNISEIDVSQNLLLEAIWTNGNNLSSINLDANTKLVVYGLSNNPYSYVSLKNGNNTNVFYFEASNTPSLDCINSDAIVSAQMSSSGKTFSEDCSTSIAGRWIMAPEAGSLKVGPTPGSDLWWFLNKFGDDIAARSCYMDDIYEFGADGSFKNVLGGETWLEPFQGADGCAVPVFPHNGSVNATYTYNQLNGSITLDGKGAYLGLPKVFNGGELSDSNAAPDSITYDVIFSDNGNAMTLSIESSAGVFWTFNLIKEAVFIPDANFEQALIDLNIDSDGTINKRILRSDAENTLEINARFPTTPWGSVNSFADPRLTITEKIKVLTGIEAFINLDLLALEHNALTSIDVSNNTQLKDLIIGGNSISTLDLELNSLLEYLNCNGNPIASLDVSLHPNLRELSLDNLLITDIDLSNIPNLESFWASNMTNLTRIEFSSNPLLRNVLINGSKLETLNLSNNPSLSYLAIRDNAFLAHLDIRNGNNSNLGLDVVNTPSLTCINADGSGLPEINQGMVNSGKTFSEDCGDFVNIPDPNFEQALIDIGIDSDGVVNTSILREEAEAVGWINLDPIGNTNLINLTGKINNITGIEAFINLEGIGLDNNEINSLDFSANTQLRDIYANNCFINTINILNNQNLVKLHLYQNQIAELDVSNNILLEELIIQSNLITELDISPNPNIKTLFATDNRLTSLNIANGNNLNFTIPYGAVSFGAAANPDLECVIVDADIVNSAFGQPWEYDTGVIFSSDCALKPEHVFIPDPNFEQSLIDLGIDSDGAVNTWILRSDAETVTSLNLNNTLFTPEGYGFNNHLITNVTGKIEDLTGIEAFINLTNLQISYSDLTTINISNNTLLEELWVTDGILTGIDVTSNTNLIQLGVSANNITGTVDVSENTALELLFIGINPINSLDVTSNTSLSYLWVPGTQITSLDISLNPNLQRLDAQYNPGLSLITDPAGHPGMTSLNLSGINLANYNQYAPLFPNLNWLLLNDNSLTRFNGNNALLVENLFLNNNSIDKLVLSSNTALKQLHATNNVLTELDVKNGNNLALQTLNVTENLLTCINVDDPSDGAMPYASWNTDLGVVLSDNCSAEPEIVLIPDSIFEQKLIDEGIDLDGIGLNGSILLSDALATTHLDVYLSGITDMTGIDAFENLETLIASHNNFNEIDLTNCTNLVSIDLSFNNLTTLNVTSGKVLTQLNVGGNDLTTLNLEALTNLTNVDLSFNDFESIDASGLDQLLVFSIHNNNNLSTLDMRNGNNAAMVNFSAENNQNLACIGVDDPISISETIWKINGSTVFSSNSDCVAPTVVTKDVTIFLDNKGKATAVASQFDNGSTDNITANANLVFSLNKTDFNCSDFGSNVVELSVTDEAGNVGIGYANVIVNDAIPPIAKAVREYAFDLAGGNTTLDASILNNGSTDNCSIASFSLSQSYFTLPGIYYVDFIAHDIGGNEGKTQVTLTVSDSENSEILTVGNVTVTVYPNPFQDYISLKFSKNMDFSTVNVSLTDFNGNPTGAAFAVQDATNLKATGLSGLAPGSYILTVSKGRKSDTAIMMKD